jgi:TonB dependent receptor
VDAGFSAGVAGLSQANTVPQFNLSGYSSLGNPQVREFIRYTHELQANVTKQLGEHSIKFGFLGQSGLINNIERWAGVFSFGRGMTSGPQAAADSSVAGNAVASLLLGTGASGSQAVRFDMAASLRYYAWYAQDTWRMTKRLTVTAGLRYELQPGATERYNRLSYLDPTAANPVGQKIGKQVLGAIRTVSADNRGLWDTDYRNFAPRISLAYKATDKLVLRTGYGIMFQPTTAMFTFDPMPGFTNDTPWSVAKADGFTPDARLSNPFPLGLVNPSSTPGLDAQVGGSPNQVWLGRNHPTGYVQHLSFDFQYELGTGSVLEVGYAYAGGRKLLFGNPPNGNQLGTQYLSMGQTLNNLVQNPFFGVITDPTSPLRFAEVPLHRLLRPYPQYNGVSITRSLPGAGSSFNALSIKYTKQFSGGLTILSTYQFSKAIDNGSEDYVGWGLNAGGSWRDAYNKSLERSISAHDVPQSLVTNFVYELPVGKGKKFGSSMPKAAQAVVGGWETSGAVRLQSGLPISLSAPNSNSAFGFQITRPDILDISKIEVGNRVADPSACCWFNPAAFGSPAPFTLGNSARYLTQVRYDQIKNVDFSLSKVFQVMERTKVRFRADLLNLFNTPQFGALNTTFGNAQFGRATGVINLPRQVQLGLKVDF